MATLNSRPFQTVISYALFITFLLFLVLVPYSLSDTLNFNEKDQLPISNDRTLESCPSIPVCNCNCAPVINLSCPAPPSSSCPPSPTPSPSTTEPPYSTTSPFSTTTEDSTTSTSEAITQGSTSFTTLLSTDSPSTTSDSTTSSYSTTIEGSTFSTTDILTTVGTTTSTSEDWTTEGPTTSTTEYLTTSAKTEVWTTKDPTTSTTEDIRTSTTEDMTTLTTKGMTTSTTEDWTTTISTRSSEPSTSTASSTLTTPFNNDNCQHVFTSNSGWFTSPNHPSSYPDSAICTWLINATGPIVLQFTQFILESNYDFLWVYDGSSASSSLVLKASGSSIPQAVISSSSQVFIKFTSDNSNTFSGFNATYSLYVATTTTTPYTGTWVTGYTNYPTGPYTDNCQAILQEDSGYFTSPYYPNNYPNNANCSWMITVPNGQRIDLWFNQIRTENNVDFIKVYNGPSISSSQLFTASGSYGSRSLTSSYNQLLITFTSDSAVTDIGFSANYSLYIPPTPPPIYECGGNITANSGYIESPNFPYSYPNNSQCTWLIISDPGTRIQFYFTDFSTKSNHYVSVYDGAYIGSNNHNRKIFQSGNVSLSCSFLSSSNALFVTFSSSFYSDSYTGFRAGFTTDHGCGVNYVSNGQETGIIETPGYHNINDSISYSSCIWQIRVDVGSKVNFTLTNLNNSYHQIYVYEGNTTNGDNLLVSARLSSSSLNPFHVISKTNEMSVLINSYESICYNYEHKLRFTYAPTTASNYGCYGTMNTNSKIITSPGYPKEYSPRLLTCQWKISELAGSRINITFPNGIDIYSGSDGLFIYDGPTSLIYKVSGTIHPMPVLTSSNETTLQFTTSSSIDNASLYSGWTSALYRVN